MWKSRERVFQAEGTAHERWNVPGMLREQQMGQCGCCHEYGG